MDAFAHLISGLISALSPLNLLMAFLGCLLGTIVGVLPGLGPTSALAILIPLTTVLFPEQAIIMMAGIYYGAMYGGSTTAILLNIPGEVASVPTCLDGFPLAQKGKAGPALGICAIGSFIAGTLGVIGLSFFAPFLGEQALRFGPPEYFALMILALTLIVALSGASLIKGLAMGSIGYLLSMVGLGPTLGLSRFTFGSMTLYGGFELISIVIGFFAISEIFMGIEESRTAVASKLIGNVFPSLMDIKKTFKSMLRGGALGFFLGMLPGCSPAVTTFLAYDIEKKVSRYPEKFGTGVLEGVAAPESANNATSSAGFIPLMVLGIPASAPLAVLFGYLMIYGLQPGPLFLQQHADFAWTVIASMYIGNIMLLVLNLPLVGIWARLTTVPYGIMAPVILMLSILGAYSVRNSMFDVGISLLFGLIGYILRKYKWPTVPLILCYILGPLLEKSFIQSLSMSQGNPMIFFQRGISLTLILAAVVLFMVSLRLVKQTERRVAQETKAEQPGMLID